ncbi:hypothetical protein LEN26_014735 [Aphanomyces euteiches]|nr:hypothetical protein LEN26_014735 [Aphanomyces euteiches]KAH9124896.1 hypothetical protein AeMF1_004394 [Aphanomyces euteiches]KAH9179420.1 hypothetical protein AeNC1_017312 [Aphanomyces euteiches]
MKRYVEIREHLRQLQDSDVDLVLPTKPQDDALFKLYSDLSLLDDVTFKLQKEKITMKDVRSCFDKILDMFPEMSGKVPAYADILQCPDFESAIVKIQMKNTAALHQAERSSVAHLKHDGDVCDMDVNYSKLSNSVNTNNYPPDTFRQSYSATSTLCERFFSRVKSALADRCGRMLPRHFEVQMFLCLHHSHWDVGGIDRILTPKSNAKQ